MTREALSEVQRELVMGSMPTISHIATSLALKYKRRRDDVFSDVTYVACEASRTFDGARRAFRTYLWRAAHLHLIGEIDRSRKEEELRRALVVALVETGVELTDVGDLLRESDAERAERLDLIRHAFAATAILGALGASMTSPERELLDASEARRVEVALNECLDALDAGDRAIIERRFFGGEPMTAIFGSPKDPAYKAAYDRHVKVLRKIGEGLFDRNIGPKTAKSFELRRP